ncbi:MAG: S-DNA-T family DNA segregation ATPase FtsK/SpoIIIE [Candidatus Omnitrophota bacterium]
MRLISEKKLNEIVAFSWLVASGLLFLCLISHNPNDIAYLSSQPNTPLDNYVGIAGAYVSWAMLSVIGKGSYFIVGLFVFWALTQWSERKHLSPWLRILSCGLFFLASCSTLTLLAGPIVSDQFQVGGITGYFVAAVLNQVFGQAAIIVSLALFFLALILATEFMIFTMSLAGINWIQNHLVETLIDRKEIIMTYIAELKEKRAEIKEPPKPKVKIKGVRVAKATAEEPEDGVLEKAKKSLFRKKTEPKPDEYEDVKVKIKTVKKPPVSKPKATPVVSAGGDYTLPDINLLVDPVVEGSAADASKLIEEQSRILDDTMSDFGIDAKVVEAEQGPVITRFELKPGSGVKLQKITALQDNIALNLQATSVRILAPIPGKPRIGIEVPNSDKQMVFLKEVLESDEMQAMESTLAFVIGKDAAGAPMIADLDQLPHLLIAGSTGSGKTVCMNTIIMSMLYRATPDEVRFIMIDPKMVELINYNGLPHLLTPVITQTDKVPAVLNWLVSEMDRRYKVLSKSGAREVEIYNERLIEKNLDIENEEDKSQPMPYIVCIIDELADLMMAQGKEIEFTITRLAQLARAVGIHMILATQRPSVDVITGVIKANFPARIAFQVTSKVDSRTVLDQNGADALLGKGDLLYMDPRKSHLTRGQGAWVTDAEINATVDSVKAQKEPVYHEEIAKAASVKKEEGGKDFRQDTQYVRACEVAVASEQASVSMLQRKLGLGYTRAARLVDMMEEDGIVGAYRGSKAREVLMDTEELRAHFLGESEAADDDDEEVEGVEAAVSQVEEDYDDTE